MGMVERGGDGRKGMGMAYKGDGDDAAYYSRNQKNACGYPV